VGYSPIDGFYVYGTGGAALGDLKPNVTANIPGLLSESSHASVWHFGWTAGGGIGYRISDKLSINTEYLYTDLGKTDLLDRHVVSDVPFAHYTADFKVTAKTTANIVRVSVNYFVN
jgi:opacity protein-like surface antigen